ncbi:MAG TPA: hypothetical protein VN112_24335 [Ensifer sp.]|nr:hypothetical protein [Ensifer sp.]
MKILMPALKRATNGDWFARKVIPQDVRDEYQRAHGVRQEERFRHPSSMPAGQAKAEFAEWVSEVERRITALRTSKVGGAQELSTRQVHVLAGRWYDWFVQQFESVSSVETYDFFYDQLQDVLEASGGLAPDDGEDREPSPRHLALIRAKVSELSRLPTFLAQEELLLDHGSHAALLDALQPDLVGALTYLRRRAGGNYAPDDYRSKFPAPAQVNPRGVKLTGWNAKEAFEAWVTERKPAAATVNRWRVVFDHLDKHVEGRDIALVSDDDAVAWKDALVKGKASGRTINEVWLTAAKGVFNWVKDQKKISANSFDGVRVAVARKVATKGEFSEDDVKLVLSATLAPDTSHRSPHLKAAFRWVPWLCAYTGARPGEMTQLRKEDVEQHKSGFWMLHIRPEAGTVKGAVARTVPIHAHLVEQGFIDFVRGSKPGPLFYNAAARSKKEHDPFNPPRPMYVQVRQKLADWVRKLGVSATNVSPTHGWRHTFKQRAARSKMETRIRDAICGHAPATVGDIYQLPNVEDMAEALKDFPRYPVDAA